MKKILFVAVLAAASVMAYAQPRAIGGRLGAFEGVSYEHGLGENNMIEVELGFGLGAASTFSEKGEKGDRYSITLRGNNLQAAFTYDWIDPFGKKFPWEHKGEWHWYMGVGAAAGYGWSYSTYTYNDAGEHVTVSWGTIKHDYEVEGDPLPKTNWGFVGAVGRIGVEYDFWFPLQLSVDYRPTLGASILGDEYFNEPGKVRGAFYWQIYDIALSVRYKF